MENRGIWTDLIKGVGLEMSEVFNQALEEYTPGIFELLNKKSGDGAQVNITGKTGVGEVELFDEGDDIPGGRRYKTYTTKIVYNSYGKHLDVTKLAIEDRGSEYEADLEEMHDLTIGYQYTIDKAGMQLFNGGFATTAIVNGAKLSLYGDGKPTFSTVHPTVVPGGSTQSNASATSIPYSHDNLETGLVAMKLQQTDDGLAMVLAGKPTVVLPTNLEKEGLEITQSQLTPQNANNAINVYKNGMLVDMATSMHLDSVNGGSNTAWFICVPGRHKLNHENRQDARLESEVAIKSKTMTFTIDGRWANSVRDWRRTWASKGDNSTYSS